jgi:hypothetical protein
MLQQLRGHSPSSEGWIRHNTLDITDITGPLNLGKPQALTVIIRADQKGSPIPLEKPLEYTDIHRTENIKLMSQSCHEFRIIWLG